MPFPAVFFDLDGTLVDEQKALHAVEREVGSILTEALGRPVDFPRDLLAVEDANIPHLGYGLASYAWSFAEAVASAHAPPESREKAMQAFARFLRGFYSGTIHVIEGAHAALCALKEGGAELHLVTRGVEFEQRHKVLHAGFQQLMDTVDVVQDRKDQSIARTAEGRGIDLSAAWMIGDSMGSDILPALSLGMNAVLIAPPMRWGHDRLPDALPVDNPRFHHVSSLASIPDLVFNALSRER